MKGDKSVENVMHDLEDTYYKSLYELEDVYEEMLKDEFAVRKVKRMNISLDDKVCFRDDNSEPVWDDARSITLKDSGVMVKSRKYIIPLLDLPIDVIKQIVYYIYEMD